MAASERDMFVERSPVEQDVVDACAKSPAGADLLISAFVAAIRSYRRASVCAPFPGFLVDRVRNKDFTSATECVIHFPPTQAVASSDYGGSGGVLNPVQKIPLRALMLLQWILRCRYHIELVPTADDLLSVHLANSPWRSSKQESALNMSIQPSHVLKLQSVDDDNRFLNAFETTKARQGSIMAFHGTTAENLHSILRCGLLNMTKTHLQRNGAVFGEGVYLSTDLGVAVFFCKSGDTWERSCLGSKVGYVLMCEVAKGEGVTCSTSGLEEPQTATTERETKHLVRKSALKKRGTYLVVENSDLIRIRYVLVYRDHIRAVVQSHRDAHVVQSTSQALSWKDRIVDKICTLDWFSLSILSYVGLLIIVGYSKSGVKVTTPSRNTILGWFVNRFRVWIGSWTNAPHW